MKFIILPLLAAFQHYTINDDAWKNGMEVIFNMTYNSKAILPNSPLVTAGNSPKTIINEITAQIKCQLEPQKPELIQCHVEELQIIETVKLMNGTISAILDNTHFPLILEFYNKYIIFEIKFDESGVADVFLPSELSAFYDDVRTMAYILHAGVDMRNLAVGNYEAMDRFWTGHCNTKYEVLGESKPAEDGIWDIGKQIVINKNRNMDKCPSKVEGYISPTIKIWSAVGTGSDLEIRSSWSYIVADNNQFFSMTQFEGVVYPIKSVYESSIRILEDIKFVYVSAAPATQPLVSMNNRKSIGIRFGTN